MATTKPKKKVKKKTKKITVNQQITALNGAHLALEDDFRELKLRVKEIAKLKTTITRCQTLIKSYENREGNSERMYTNAMLRMREIHKDYISLFKKWGTTITFFEKRIPGEDWIPGGLREDDTDPSEEKNRPYDMHSGGRPGGHSVTPFNRKDK